MAGINNRLQQRLTHTCGTCKNFKEGSTGYYSIGTCMLTVDRKDASTGLPDGATLPVNRNTTYGYGACYPNAPRLCQSYVPL